MENTPSAYRVKPIVFMLKKYFVVNQSDRVTNYELSIFYFNPVRTGLLSGPGGGSETLMINIKVNISQLYKSISNAKFEFGSSSTFGRREQGIKFGCLFSENGFNFKKTVSVSRIVFMQNTNWINSTPP